MNDAKTFWHINEYTYTSTGKEKIDSYLIYGNFNEIKEKLDKKNVKYTISVIKPIFFKNFKKIEEI